MGHAYGVKTWADINRQELARERRAAALEYVAGFVGGVVYLLVLWPW